MFTNFKCSQPPFALETGGQPTRHRTNSSAEKLLKQGAPISEAHGVAGIEAHAETQRRRSAETGRSQFEFGGTVARYSVRQWQPIDGHTCDNISDRSNTWRALRAVRAGDVKTANVAELLLCRAFILYC